jgi:signal transduction histidine kinase
MRHGDAVLSLRSRVLLGAILWTAGLFILAGVLHTAVMLRHPHVSEAFFAFFENTLGASTIALVFLVVGLIQVRRGLASLDQLRSRLAAVHEASSTRVEGTYPAEVAPLVSDLNALLVHREEAVRRAVAKAGDLAHGLKTPLAVLAQEAGRAARSGHSELAAAIDHQVERMRRQIDYHLAHARAAASGAMPGTRCSVAESIEGLARTLQHLHADRGLTIDIHVSPEHIVRGQREDVDEMLGNLLDNACKWTKSRVTVSSSTHNSSVVITVDDDGPGIETSMREAVLRRGVRADEQAPGSGLGLAIVRDLAELYGGSVRLSDSPLGGLRARLQLPSA